MLLSDPSRVAKVVILSYMRGGSTLFFKMFDNKKDDSMLAWFEPLDSFYSTYFGLSNPNIPLTLLYQGNLTRR